MAVLCGGGGGGAGVLGGEESGGREGPVRKTADKRNAQVMTDLCRHTLRRIRTD